MNSIYLLDPFTEDKNTSPHNNLEFIKYYLRDHGYHCEIIDCNHYENDLKRIVSSLAQDINPIIGITAYTRERFHAYGLIKAIRENIPRSLIVVGGRHFGFLPDETLSALPQVDIVVRGEGEITFREICDAVYNETDFSDIKGITYRHDQNIISNPDRPLERDIDQFRCFDIDDAKHFQKYSLLGQTKLDPHDRYFTVLASRGCPNKCVFCSLSAEKVRMRSVENILEEIEDKIRFTGVRNVSFIDPSLTLNRKFVVELCEKMIENKMKLKWNCYSRVNIETDLLDVMREAGLASVEIGLESASPKVLKAIRKNINLEQFETFCREAYLRKIKTFVFCMISLPDETIEDCDLTRNYIEKMSRYIYSAGIQTTRILPDAALFRIAEERGGVLENFSWFEPYSYEDKEKISRPSFRHIPLYQDHLTQRQIKAKMIEFNDVIDRNFFFMHNLRHNIRSWISAFIKGNISSVKTFERWARALRKTVYSVKNIGKNKYYHS